MFLIHIDNRKRSDYPLFFSFFLPCEGAKHSSIILLGAMASPGSTLRAVEAEILRAETLLSNDVYRRGVCFFFSLSLSSTHATPSKHLKQNIIASSKPTHVCDLYCRRSPWWCDDKHGRCCEGRCPSHGRAGTGSCSISSCGYGCFVAQCY